MYIYQSLSIILSIILFSSLQQVTLLKMVGLPGQIGLLALLHVVMESSKEVDHVTALITAVKGPLFRPDPALYMNVINDVSITICCMQQLKDETFTSCLTATTGNERESLPSEGISCFHSDQN